MIDFYCFGSLPKLAWCDKIETQLVVKDDADMAWMLRMLLQGGRVESGSGSTRMDGPSTLFTRKSEGDGSPWGSSPGAAFGIAWQGNRCRRATSAAESGRTGRRAGWRWWRRAL